ncbi:MAG: hypothetical protein COB16_09650 [Rhodobacteraceae bacterium]|nr:MAG: hypothetical protein COB16_09650 [Paracoccaceae bacterium]
MDFISDQINAAKLFAQTMIVVDDDTSTSGEVRGDDIPANIETPGRGAALGADQDVNPISENSGDPLDAKALIEQSLELGLICSVLVPSKTDQVVQKVAKAAERADIVSLDWQMHRDDGDLAKKIIKKIVDKDSKSGGRLRLVAIYTGVRDRDRIFTDILTELPETTRQKYGIRIADDCITSNNGLRVVWLLKETNVAIDPSLGDFQVSEKNLPERLQMEFAKLSQGLLSNVALELQLFIAL